jgi:hypothetical protein
MPVSASRLALLRVYAALDRLSPPDPPEAGHLDTSLQILGLDVDELGDPRMELERFAAAIREERAVSQEEAPIPLVRVVETAMDVLAVDVEVSDETLGVLAEQFLEEEVRGDPEVVNDVVAALRIAAETHRTDKAERWREFQREARSRTILLLEEVRNVTENRCTPRLYLHKGEWATRIETYFEIDHGTYDLDGLANACMPNNWRSCNNFFCSLTHCPDRDRDCPGTTPGTPPQPAVPYWRTVFEEKVLVCPNGVFPDTFLLFTWTRRPRQLILEYELARPPRPGDRTVLTVDQGFLQVDKLTRTYSVRTVKKLLFDDAFLPSGGQTLARYGCELGWLDYSITQFTACGRQFPPVPPEPKRPGQPDATARLRKLMDRWEEQSRACAAVTVTEVDECVAHLRAGDLTFDQHFAGLTQKLATRAGKDGSNLVTAQLDYALASVDLATEFVEKWRRSRDWA